MINEIPKIIYDNNGNEIKITRITKKYFKDKNKEGYIFHIEKGEKIGTISEFDLELIDGKYIINRDIFLNVSLI